MGLSIVLMIQFQSMEFSNILMIQFQSMELSIVLMIQFQSMVWHILCGHNGPVCLAQWLPNSGLACGLETGSW